MLTDAICERARIARDPRFDGLFFIGVRTTGIYCRPICPAVSPKRKNVAFFQSAAAAGEAGFRPCLRCRPESAPGTPAWNGTSTTVRRGLRLIAGGALDDGGVERLAERLGVTGRHLRRLFADHVGASPQSVAHTERLHFAKRLIDETALPLSHVAAAAGFRSIRRFNDAFRKSYGRSPRELRRLSDRAAFDRPALQMRLACRQPFDWATMLRFLSGRATPGVEEVSGQRYRRTLRLGESAGIVTVEPAEKPGYLALSLSTTDTGSLFDTVRAARDVFDLDAPVAAIAGVLSRDALLRGLVRRHPGIRVPGAWCGFELTVRAILGQQISVRAATTLAGRMALRYGEPLPADLACDGLTRLFPTPARLARARFNDMGLIGSRIDTIRRLSAAVAAGDIAFDTARDPAEIYRALTAVKGIGDWTAQYVSMRALKHPDAFPASDLGLIKAAAGRERITPKALLERAECWRPWRAYAAMLLWQSPAAGGG